MAGSFKGRVAAAPGSTSGVGLGVAKALTAAGADLVIINSASAHELVASPVKSACVAATHGVPTLTKTVASEVAAQHIAVNATCPGYVRAPLVESQTPDAIAARGLGRDEAIRDAQPAAHPPKAFAPVAEVAALATFLCSAGASITCAILPVEGGWTAH